MVNSKIKGANGEREISKILAEMLGDSSFRRGQQFKGSEDSPDIMSDNYSSIHFEIKRVERLNLDNAMRQSIKDAGSKIPVVVHRKNRQKWLMTLRLEDLLRLVKELSEK